MKNKLCNKAIAMLVFILMAQSKSAFAQYVAETPKETNKMVLSAKLNGNLVNFSWPKMIHWTELQQQAAETNASRWTPVPDTLYSTNNGTISATLPLNEKLTYYRVLRFSFITKPLNFRQKRPALITPPTPPPSTNKPAGKTETKAPSKPDSK